MSKKKNSTKQRKRAKKKTRLDSSKIKSKHIIHLYSIYCITPFQPLLAVAAETNFATLQVMPGFKSDKRRST